MVSVGEIVGIAIGIIFGTIIVCFCFTCCYCSSSEDSSGTGIKRKLKLDGKKKVWAAKRRKKHSFSLSDEDVEQGDARGYEIAKEDGDYCQKEESDNGCCNSEGGNDDNGFDSSGGNDGGGCDYGGGNNGGGCDSECGGADDG